MDKTKYQLTAGLLISLSLLHTCRCQQGTLFNQSPFQQQQRQQQQTQQLRQQLQQQQLQQQQRQQQQAFPNALGALNPLSSLTPLNAISPIVPQSAYRTYNQLNPQNFVPITAYQNELNYDGSFAYGYSAGDGTTAQAQGYVKNLGLGEALEAQVVQGSYSYTSPEGTPITVRYIADENGFRAEGAHIPTPPPIPDAIAKSLQYFGGAGQQYQQTLLNPNLNPYQTPYRQFPTAQTLRPGQPPLQQQQQQRAYQQQQNSGQYQPELQFGAPQQQTGGGVFGQFAGQPGGGFGGAGSFVNQQQQNSLPQQQQPNQQQNFTQQQQQQNLQQQQAAAAQQQQQKQQQQQQQQQNSQQQQLATQELRGRPSQLVNSFGYNQYRRFKKATKK